MVTQLFQKLSCPIKDRYYNTNMLELPVHWEVRTDPSCRKSLLSKTMIYKEILKVKAGRDDTAIHSVALQLIL